MASGRSVLVLALLLVVLALPAACGDAPAPAPPPRIAVSCELTVGASKVRAGFEPELHVRVRNDSDVAIVLPAAPVANVTTRSGRCRFEIRREDGTPVESPAVLGCGAVGHDTLASAAFVRLVPGESFDPRAFEFGAFHWGPSSDWEPGRYVIRYHYGTHELQREVDFTDPEVRALFADVPAVEIASNEVVVEVLPREPSLPFGPTLPRRD